VRNLGLSIGSVKENHDAFLAIDGEMKTGQLFRATRLIHLMAPAAYPVGYCFRLSELRGRLKQTIFKVKVLTD
jgi:hypothetical protein